VQLKRRLVSADVFAATIGLFVAFVWQNIVKRRFGSGGGMRLV
jgi:hypothetical protein